MSAHGCIRCIIFYALISSSRCYNPSRLSSRSHSPPNNSPSPPSDRRAFLSSISVVTSSLVAVPNAVVAFDNRLDDKYADVTPQVGRQPDNLGPATRASRTAQGGSYEGLAPCSTSPNCWCSSPPFGDNPARYLAPWKGGSISDVKKVIDSYEVGQQGIDGGGFRIVTFDEGKRYLYVQFQSYKAGYVDDVEFWYNPVKQAFDVRSASRIGMSDLGVNAKRLNYIGGRLENEFGWALERRKNGSLV